MGGTKFEYHIFKNLFWFSMFFVKYLTFLFLIFQSSKFIFMDQKFLSTFILVFIKKTTLSLLKWKKISVFVRVFSFFGIMTSPFFSNDEAVWIKALHKKVLLWASSDAWGCWRCCCSWKWCMHGNVISNYCKFTHKRFIGYWYLNILGQPQLPAPFQSPFAQSSVILYVDCSVVCLSRELKCSFGHCSLFAERRFNNYCREIREMVRMMNGTWKRHENHSLVP